MQMLSPEALTAITIAFYLVASICGITGIIRRNPALSRAGCWLAISAFFCQTLFLVLGFHRLMPSGLSLGAYLQLLAWFLLLCGIGAWLRLRQDAILLFAAPLGLILFLASAPLLNLSISLPGSLTAPFYALHIGSLFLGLGVLGLAFVAGLAFLVLEARIKARKKMQGVWKAMPALSLLDKINAFCSATAFPLYTTGLVAGLFWAKPVFGSGLSGDSKVIVSIFIWMLLALLFHNRLALGWRGRKPALLACVIFLLSCFSVLVVNTFLSTHHGVIRSQAHVQWIST